LKNFCRIASLFRDRHSAVMNIAVFSALFLPRLGSAFRFSAGVLVLAGFGFLNAYAAEPPQVVADRSVERFALLCLAHMGQPEGTAAAARQAGLASLSGDVLRRYDATQGWSTVVADRRASVLLHPDGNCSLLIDSLPLPLAFKAVEGKLSALSAGERLRSGKIGRDYALRYRNLPAMVSVAGSPGNESGEVLFKTLANDLPGQRAERPLAPPTVVTPSPSAPSPTPSSLPPITATVSPVPPTGTAVPPASSTVPAPFPPVASSPSSAPPQLSAPALPSSPLTAKSAAGSSPAPFPAPGNSAPVTQAPSTQLGNPSSAVITPPAASLSVPPAAPVTIPQNAPAPSSPTPTVAEAPIPNLPLFSTPATPSLSPDLLPPSPSVAATPLTPVDPDKPIAEASLVALFADSCLTTKGSYAALQAKADAQGWRAMLPAAARDGFDFSWLIVPGKGVRLGLFLDSLRQKCCVSAFPADPSLIRQAIDARLSLGTATSQVSKLKEVYVYPPKDGLTVSADFERTEPNAVFANVCSRPKLP